VRTILPVRSSLRLNSPWQGTGNAQAWSFDGADDRQLRDCLAQLDAFTVSDPADRWTAAVILFEVDYYGQGFGALGHDFRPAGQWSRAGALRLAELLPDALTDLRDDLRARFANPRSDSPRRPS
jgi:hypothetical protein